MKDLLLILVVLLNVSEIASGGKHPARYVSFCEIVRHPEKYDQQVVLTAGVIEPGMLFFDPACKPRPGPDPTLPLDLTLSVIQDVKEKSAARKRLDDLVAAKESVFVVVEARFDAYNRYEGPVPNDERLRELLQKGHARFGYDNCCRFRLAVKQVMLAEPAAEEALAPAAGP